MAKTGRGGGSGKGKPKGYKFPKTLEKDAARQAYRDFMAQHMTDLHLAQVRAAKGLFHLLLRDPTTGQFTRFETSGDEAVDKAQLDAAAKMGRQACWISVKDPSAPLLIDAFNRYYDKPAEQPQQVDVAAEIVIRWQPR